MSYQQNSSRLRRLPDFFGITDSSGLIPLSQIRDNGIINNGVKEDRSEKKSSVMEKLQEKKVEASMMEKVALKQEKTKAIEIE